MHTGNFFNTGTTAPPGPEAIYANIEVRLYLHSVCCTYIYTYILYIPSQASHIDPRADLIIQSTGYIYLMERERERERERVTT